MTFDRRVRHLEVIYRRRGATRSGPPTGFDASRLTGCEQFELDLLLERAEHGPRPPGVRAWAFPGLCDCRLDRASDLMNKAHGLPPALSPGLGPCRGCIAAEIEDEVAPCRRALGEHDGVSDARRMEARGR